MGAEFFTFIKSNNIKELSINPLSIQSKPENDFIGRFLHGFKLKAYEFNVYKAKKNKNEILINILGQKNKITIKNEIKFKALEEGTNFARDLVSEPPNVLNPKEYVSRLLKLND